MMTHMRSSVAMGSSSSSSGTGTTSLSSPGWFINSLLYTVVTLRCLLGRKRGSVVVVVIVVLIVVRGVDRIVID